MHLRLLLILAALTGVIFSQSPPPVPRPTKADKGEQRDTNKEEQRHEKVQQSTSETTVKDRSVYDKPPIPDHHSEKGQRPSSADWWTAGFTGALVLVACAQLVVYGQQARYMRRGLRLTRQSADAATLAANIARDGLQIAERAYVQITARSLPIDSLKSETPIHIECSITNDGRTPASQLRFYISAGMCKEPLPEDLPAGNFGHATTFHPRPNFLRCFCDTRPTTQAEIDELLTSQLRLVVWGRVEYADVFGIARFANLRAVSFRDGNQLSFTFTSKGNDSD